MIYTISGQRFREMIDYGVRNLNIHRQIVNQLNVFPVPDGDTGTNMVTTIANGLSGTNAAAPSLSEVAKGFADAVVFGARGNSGVIVSQFLKGVSETFFGREYADAQLFAAALENGVKCAYTAVATPVEGTILTVVKEATAAVSASVTKGQSINEVVDLFVERSKQSLEKTPQLLPALREAGVVDSGGAGIVYLFEGMQKYLAGESLQQLELEVPAKQPDYSAFDKDSVFDYGYCTEFLLQLQNSKIGFDYDDFKGELSALGSSIVTSCEKDKVRVHIHTELPERVLEFAHRYGEFLSLKIENMTVQHTETVGNIALAADKGDNAFSVVAVASDRSVQRLFVSMGADAVIYCEESASIKDYIDAFEKLGGGNIIVFPNSNDSVLTAIQAKNIYTKANVTVINSKSVAYCYCALPILDFSEEDIGAVTQVINEAINSLYIVSIAHRNKPVIYGDRCIDENAFYAYRGKEILSLKHTLVETALDVVRQTLKKYDKDVLTLFYGANISDEQIDAITRGIAETDSCLEVFTVPMEKLPCDLTVSFE